jgi:beta-galactosidase
MEDQWYLFRRACSLVFLMFKPCSEAPGNAEFAYMSTEKLYPAFGFLLAIFFMSPQAFCQDANTGGKTVNATFKHAAPEAEVSQLRERILFNDNWLFSFGDPAGSGNEFAWDSLKSSLAHIGNLEFLSKHVSQNQQSSSGSNAEPRKFAADVLQNKFDDSQWRKLDLPHDWAAEGNFETAFDNPMGRLKNWGPVWYRKHFSVKEDLLNKKFFLEIDGAMSHSLVFLNGNLVGGWPYGYSSFQLDITKFLTQGENLIAIRLENPAESSRWYPGAGIYRNVWLSKCDTVHVGHWGTFVRCTELSKEEAKIAVTTQIANDGLEKASVEVQTDFYELNSDDSIGRKVASSTKDSLQIEAQKEASLNRFIDVKNPNLWNLKTRNRYLAITNIEMNGVKVDSYKTSFGIRTIKFDSEKGFLLNGQRVQIQGVCNHHDLGPLGTALNLSALSRQLEILKEMGCNAIRTSHNPPAPELLDLCDKYGFLVMDEAFDCWQEAKCKGDYHSLFDDWHEKDLRALIRRDRNHPCVILWSIGNEIAEMSTPKGVEIGKELVRIAHEEDSTRPMTAACHDTQSGYNGFQNVVDVFGYNYKPHEYAKFHATHPNKPLLGSETSSTVTSRGEYFFPVSSKLAEQQTDFQVSSYDLCFPVWASSPDAEFKGQDETPGVCGEFVWTGFDYIGEPTPFDSELKVLPRLTDKNEENRYKKELDETGKIRTPARSSYFGIVDLCGFKKDRFYLYQARWRPDLAMAHILPHWNWPERKGLITPVHVYTSGDEAELFLNGRSLGKKKKGHLEYRLCWNEVIYEPGELTLTAYKNGKEWARDSVKTSGEAKSIGLSAEQKSISARDGELAFVDVLVEDSARRLVPRANHDLEFHVEGPGEIVVIANGDAADLTPFKTQRCRSFNGRCLVIVKANGAGAIKSKASSPTLTSAEISLLAR